MNDIFKPTKAKILVTLLLPLYIGFVVEVETIAGVEAITRGWQFILLPYVVLLFGIIAVIATRGDVFAGSDSFSIFENVWYVFSEALLPLVINYLISCGLVYLWKNFWHRFHRTSPVQHKLPPVSPNDDMKL